jgi:hypothetical protein
LCFLRLLRQCIISTFFFNLTRYCRSYHPSMDEVDLNFATHRNFMTRPHEQQGWHAAAGAFDYRHYHFYVASLRRCTQTCFCLRGTSKFPLDGTKRNVEFPAVSPKILPRQESNFVFKLAPNAHRMSVFFSIIFSASNFTSLDVDFLKSQNKASAWPVFIRSQHLVFTHHRCRIEPQYFSHINHIDIR